MGLGLDILGLSETGWTVKATNRFLVKAAVGISVGGGRIDAKFDAKGKYVAVGGAMFGLGFGAGGQFSPGNELMRGILKYANVFKFSSFRTDLYRYAMLNDQEPTPDRLANCDLVLTTISGNAAVFGGSLDYYAFYYKGEPNLPRWLWFAAGAEVTGGGSGSLMQYKTDYLSVQTA